MRIRVYLFSLHECEAVQSDEISFSASLHWVISLIMAQNVNIWNLTSLQGVIFTFLSFDIESLVV
jgi:hypothetical protein